MFEGIRRKWQETADDEDIEAVMVDIDWFKQDIDTYGHPAGDDCLQAVGFVLQFVAEKYQMIAAALAVKSLRCCWSLTYGACLGTVKANCQIGCIGR